jgi:(S)-ureidoglycine aminohydrolase
MISDESTTLVIFERRYTATEDPPPDLIVGSTDKQPLLETPGEVFQLRKLLPTSLPYDFNIHVSLVTFGFIIFLNILHAIPLKTGA